MLPYNKNNKFSKLKQKKKKGSLENRCRRYASADLLIIAIIITTVNL